MPFSACHYWRGPINNKGYGNFYVAKVGLKLAHRVSYQMNNGAIPDGLVVRHTCDQPLCVNPNHLVLGSQKDNAADAIQRGRIRRGDNHPCTKIPQDQISVILERLACKERPSDIARDYGVTVGQISSIRHGSERCAGLPRTEALGRADRRIDPVQARAIYRDAWATGEIKSVAEKHGVSPFMVSDIKRGATYASATGHRR